MSQKRSEIESRYNLKHPKSLTLPSMARSVRGREVIKGWVKHIETGRAVLAL